MEPLTTSENYPKQYRRGTISNANGANKTQVYYPRPRSFSAGSPSITTSNSKRLSTPVNSSSSVTPSVKVIRINTAMKAYGKAKSLEEGKKSLASPTSTSTLRYKTELCRPFQDSGFCKYGDKCQFAHGEQDLRSLPRHPKYKTELCRTYHTRGICPYGSRCHFIHCVDEARKAQLEGTSGCGSSGSGAAPMKSPTKRTLSFTMPLSPSLDSGISSPDDYQRGKYFDFPSNDHSSSGSSDGDYVELEQSLEQDPFFQPYHPSSGQDLVMSPDMYMDMDIFNVGRPDSPTKPLPQPPVLNNTMTPPVKDYPTEVSNIQNLLAQMSMEDPVSSPRSLTSSHRLPVFDDIMNTRSESALLDMKADNTEVQSPSKLVKFFNQAA